MAEEKRGKFWAQESESKIYLKSIRRLERSIDTKIEQLESLRAVAEKVTVNMSREAVQTSGKSDKVGNMTVKIVSLEHEIDDMTSELADLKSKVVGQIEELKNEDHRLLLTMRYLNYRSWKDIEKKMAYTKRHVLRIHGEAMNEFETCHLMSPNVT